MTKPKAAFFNQNTSQNSKLYEVYGRGRREKVDELTDLYPNIVTLENFDEHAANLQDLEVIFSTWGMPKLTEEQIAQLPALKAVFYGAGSVKGFAPSFLKHGITVVSAWAANAVPVAEFTLAQILLACKGYFQNTREFNDPEIPYWGAHRGPGVYGEKIALIGAGQIGRKVVELLKPFQLDILVVDPFLSDADAAAMEVTKVALEEAFSEAYVVSNHLPNLEHLKGMLNQPLFESMRVGATFINTGRGAQVDENALIETFKKRPDLNALLDVTFPEPATEDSELRTLPNVQLTTHIAGSINDEVLRMADYVIEEFQRWRDGKPLQYSVTLEMLENMA